jgi:mannose PTS system EIID component
MPPVLTPTFPQALLIGLLYFAANTSLLGGLGYFTTWRPVVNGLLVGIVLGDPVRGATVGALVNVLYLGYISVGGTLGMGDAALAGILGATAGILAPLSDPAQAVGLGVIAGLLLGNLGFALLTLRMKLDGRIVHAMDRAADRGDARALVRLNVLGGQGMLLAITLPAAAILALLAPIALNLLAANAPAWILRAIGAAGTGLSAALGIALALKFVFKGRNIPLFFAAFALVALTGLNAAWFALAALAIALLLEWRRTTSEGRRTTEPAARQSEIDNRQSAIGNQVFLLWQFFSHSSYSFERLQGSGFAGAMAPGIERLYANIQERAAALKRQLAFFNVEPNWGTVVLGVTLKMEQQLAAGQISAETITATKQALMGTVSGFGDTISQGAILPLVMAIGLAIGLDRSQPWLPFAGVAIYLALIGPLMVAISYRSFRAGHERGRDAVLAMLGNRAIKRWVALAQALGAFMLGGLAAMPSVTGLRLNVPGADELIAAILNAIIPLALVMLFYLLAQKTRLKPTWVLLGIIVFSLLLALAGLI